jgi:hypothetical protein
MRSPSPSRFGSQWLRRLGRTLAIVAQFLVLVAPLAEGREDRALAAHVEVPGSQQHPAHHPETCPACVLLSVHSRVAERSALPPIERAGPVVVSSDVRFASRGAAASSNSCRAPPALV